MFPIKDFVQDFNNNLPRLYFTNSVIAKGSWLVIGNTSACLRSVTFNQ